jgi:hypothetical protein
MEDPDSKKNKKILKRATEKISEHPQV